MGLEEDRRVVQDVRAALTQAIRSGAVNRHSVMSIVRHVVEQKAWEDPKSILTLIVTGGDDDPTNDLLPPETLHKLTYLVTSRELLEDVLDEVVSTIRPWWTKCISCTRP